MNLTSNPGYNRRRGQPLDKLVHSARLLSLTKTKKWLHKIIDIGTIQLGDGYTLIETPEDTANFKSFIDIMIEGFTRRYDNNWDVHLDKVGESAYTINFFTIFPSIIITNSKGASHTIKDLVVTFPIGCTDSVENRTFFLKRLEGTRASYYQVEIDSNYSHSHLRSSVATESVDNPFYASTFCIGEGDLSFLEGALQRNFNIRDLEAYLYEVDATVRWESLQGKPYMYIHQIIKPKREAATYQPSDAMFFNQEVVKYPLNVDFYVSNNRYRIKENPVYYNFILETLELPIFDIIKKEVICTYNSVTKRYYKQGSEEDTIRPFQVKTYSGEKAYLIYNGQKKYFSVMKNPTERREIVSQEVHVIHPKFLKDVHTALEKLLHDKSIRHSAISKYYSVEYQSSHITQDTVSL